MGTGRHRRGHRAHTKKKGFKKYSNLCVKNRSKDLDQVQDELEKGGLTFDYDPDLPGGGQFYLPEAGRHFITAQALEAYKKTKVYKKRLKKLKEEKYTQDEANFGAGATKEVLPPAHGKAKIEKADVEMKG